MELGSTRNGREVGRLELRGPIVASPASPGLLVAQRTRDTKRLA